MLSTLITRQAHCSDGGDDEPAEHDELAEHDEDAKPAEHDELAEPDEQVEQAEQAELAELALHAGHMPGTLQRWR